MIPQISYYYSLKDIYPTLKPFAKYSLSNLLLQIYDYETEEDLLLNVELPPDFITNENIYNELTSLIIGRFFNEYCFKIDKFINEEAPNNDEINARFIEWGYLFTSVLNFSHDYYMTLLNCYRNAKGELMDDITATSKNKVKFNDTPQNANTGDKYEGDNYITHFTATESESKSPLNSKIIRLKEIQDNYKNVLNDWVNEFHKLFIEEANV